MVVGQIYATCNKEMKQFLQERCPEGLEELTRLAEQCREAHPNKENRGPGKDQNGPNNSNQAKGEFTTGGHSGHSKS